MTTPNRNLISLEFSKDYTYEDLIIKDLYFNDTDAQKFINLFNLHLKKLNINLSRESDYEEEDYVGEENELSRGNSNNEINNGENDLERENINQIDDFESSPIDVGNSKIDNERVETG